MPWHFLPSLHVAHVRTGVQTSGLDHPECARTLWMIGTTRQWRAQWRGGKKDVGSRELGRFTCCTAGVPSDYQGLRVAARAGQGEHLRGILSAGINATSARRQGRTRRGGRAEWSGNGASREVEASGGQRALLNHHRRRLRPAAGTMELGKGFRCLTAAVSVDSGG